MVEAVASDQVVREKCTKQLVRIVSRKLKYLLCHPVIGQYTAENAIRSIDQLDIRSVNNRYLILISRKGRCMKVFLPYNFLIFY